MYSPRSESIETPVTSRPEDAVFELITNSILGIILLSIAVKTAFWINKIT